MCGRYGLTTYPGELIRRLGARAPARAFAARYNIAPTQPLLAVLNDDERSVAELRWGLVPPWAESPAAIKLTTFNARVETIATAPLYRDALRRTRCVLPASGYYEWQKHANGAKRPFWIYRRDGRPFVFAGLWSTWRRAGEVLRSCTIVTQPPNDFVRQIHSRMPVVLSEAEAAAWLAPGDGDPSAMLALLEPQPSAPWTAHEVSRRVGNVRSDDEELLAQVGDLS